ncbi:hypothetical protein AKJ16_DCAP24842 [Drosera capensis]
MITVALLQGGGEELRFGLSGRFGVSFAPERLKPLPRCAMEEIFFFSGIALLRVDANFLGLRMIKKVTMVTVYRF